MKKKTLFIIVLLFCFTRISSVFAGKPGEPACEIMHKGKFKYANTSNAIITINGHHHKESYAGGKYVIVSYLEWVNDCEYKMRITRVTVPEFPYKVGDQMTVKITRVEGDQIYYTATVKGDTMTGSFIKLK